MATHMAHGTNPSRIRFALASKAYPTTTAPERNMVYTTSWSVSSSCLRWANEETQQPKTRQQQSISPGDGYNRKSPAVLCSSAGCPSIWCWDLILANCSLMLEQGGTNTVALSPCLILDDEAPGYDAARAADADLQRLGQAVPEVQGPLPPVGAWIGRPFQQTHWNKVWQQRKRTSSGFRKKVGWRGLVVTLARGSQEPQDMWSRSYLIPGLPALPSSLFASSPLLVQHSLPGHGAGTYMMPPSRQGS
jgi:hypothetical protein